MSLHAYGVQNRLAFVMCSWISDPYWEMMLKREDMKRRVIEREVYEWNWNPCIVRQKRCQVDWLCNFKAHTLCLLYNQCWEDFSLIRVFLMHETCKNVLVQSVSVRCSWQTLLWVLSICRCYCETENTLVSPMPCAELIESHPHTC